ncbi:MAG: hypothetical protein PPP55_09175, partial [Halorubrum sp.]
GDNGSGAEASSPPPDVRRSSGRGVEEATGIPRSGTPGNPGCPFIHTLNLLDTDQTAIQLVWRRESGGSDAVNTDSRV